MKEREPAYKTETGGAGEYGVARQPILDRSGQVVAYELLFRSGRSPMASVEDPSRATASVLVNTLAALGAQSSFGRHKGFFNFELELLMDDSLSLLPKERTVLELLETLQVTPELIERCRVLKRNGFTLALDDHVYDRAFRELYQIVDIVKIDLFQSRAEGLGELVDRFRPYRLQLLAEKVETREEFIACRELGFDLFQGYYFGAPALLEKEASEDPVPPLRDLLQLLDCNAEMPEIEKVFSGNAGLTANLLTLVGSIGRCTLDGVGRVRDAIAALGRRQVKHWVQLALCAATP